MAESYAICTLLTNDAYLPGAIALVAALRDLHPKPAQAPEVDFQAVCLVTPETVDVSSIKLLRRTFDLVVGVEIIDQTDDKNLQLLGRPDLNHVLTKLHIFRLTQFSKVLFLDADVLPLRPMSHLLALPHEFSAVPDVGWPDIFNSGVMALTPSDSSFEDIRSMLKSRGTWDGGDQGLLNEWRGDDWNRLSFTYNTTPTAAYTYAPAYERFGSKISAIHFIGPNKPWVSIPYRAPGSSAFRKQVEERQSVYDYGSLVDRWFAVYDRHYRAVQPAPSPLDFELQRYDSAWDDGISIGAEVVPSAALQASVGSTWAGSHGSAHLQALPGVGGYPSQVQASGPLGLNELRRLAAEGVDGIFFASASLKPEGEYRRLPLDGRIDLMRPKRELSPSILDVEDISGGETPRQASFPADLTRMVTLPTPDASELPPAPRPHHAALPGMRRRHQRVHDPHAEHGPHSSDSGLDGDWMDQPPFPGHKRNRSSPPRAMSPPKITWNPATDPPPNNPPPQSAFPTETYFANAWDKPQTRSNDAVFQPFSLEAPKSADGPFFRAPPSAAIPETLIREGHYSNIVDHGQSVQPDPNKVKAVFPWEEQPRRAPSRSFPKSESPPRDTKYIKEKSMASPVASSGPRPPMHHTISSSLSDPSKFNFSNAWDSVPSIRNYATKLARPGQATPPHVPSFDDSEYHRERARLERQEAGRNDADDEDEGDDEDSMDERSSRDRSRSASNDRYRYEEDEDESHTPAYRPSTSKPRHARIRSGHNSPVHAPFIVKKEYRTQGVQTSFLEPEITSVQRTSFGVQVNTPDVLTSRPSSRTHSRASSRSAGDVRRTSFSNKLPTSRQGSSEDVRGRTESLPVRRDRTPLSLSRIGPLAPSAFIRSESRRTSGGKASPLIQSSPGNSSPQPSSSPTDAPPALRRHKLGSLSSEMLPVGLGLGRPDNLVFPRRIEREVSGDSIETNTTSPPESLATPTTPYGEFDPASYGSAGRKSGRQWNPNTGVDVFKRSSEEVLSRFLRQGSWDGDEPAPHLSSPGPTNSR